MKQALVSMAAALSLLLPFAAAAQMRSDTGPSASGPYLGAGIGRAKARDACEGVAGTFSCDDKDTAWRIFGGYQLNRYFAAELGYTDLGTSSASGPGASASIDAKAWELSGLGMIPIVGGLSAYGKLGVYYGDVKSSATLGAASTSTSDNNTDLTFGLGAQYDFTRNLGLRAEWQRYKDMGGDSTGKSDFDAMTVGVLYRFQ
jgi:OOP family OmpA-OmpF porin